MQDGNPLRFVGIMQWSANVYFEEFVDLRSSFLKMSSIWWMSAFKNISEE
jgi:hypothetical protein